MITWISQEVVGYEVVDGQSRAKEYGVGVCLSSDTKPTQGIGNGSALMEMDTATVKFFDEENKEWKPWTTVEGE